MSASCLRNATSATITIVLLSTAAHAQNFPTKPIRVLTSEPGGALDFTARMITPGLSAMLGQQVVVDNRGGGAVAAEAVAKAPADGHTLLLNGNNQWILQMLRNNVPYDAVKDFAPISLAMSAPIVLVVHPALGVNSVKELIAVAKAKPGALNYGTPGTGSSNHLAGELFKSMAGVDIVRIPYKGGGPALNALLGNQVQLIFSAASETMPHIKSGRLRVLAIASPQPSALMPGLPTIAASGLPGFEAVTVHGIYAPTGTPPAVIDKLSQSIMRILRQPEVKDRFFAAGTEAVGSTPEELAAFIKTDMALMGKVIRDAGIREE